MGQNHKSCSNNANKSLVKPETWKEKMGWKIGSGRAGSSGRVENQIFQQAKQEDCCQLEKRSVEFYCWVHVTHMLLEMGESSIQFWHLKNFEDFKFSLLYCNTVFENHSKSLIFKFCEFSSMYWFDYQRGWWMDCIYVCLQIWSTRCYQIVKFKLVKKGRDLEKVSCWMDFWGH